MALVVATALATVTAVTVMTFVAGDHSSAVTTAPVDVATAAATMITRDVPRQSVAMFG